MNTSTGFDYETAFSRNLGLVSPGEQERLRSTCVGLPGLGGVGSAHLQVLARLGIGAFHLADPDSFETSNIHRQLGATVQTVGRSKTEVLAETARSINPEAKVTSFAEGINAENIGAFLDGVDIVVDGIEFFALDAHRLLHAACRARGIPVVMAGPIGYGAAVWVFQPDGPAFDDYFHLENGMTRAECLLAFGLGHARGLVSDIDPARLDLQGQRGPALCSACVLCAAVAATEVLKLVCKRGVLAKAPRGLYLDVFRGRMLTLRSRPPLRRTLAGRFLRWIAFRRCPAFRRMHEEELASRQVQAETVAETASCAVLSS